MDKNLENFQTQRKLDGKSLSKSDLRYILSDTTVDLSTRKNFCGELVMPISHKKFKSWIKSILKELGLSEDEYKKTRIFTPKQVSIIIEELL